MSKKVKFSATLIVIFCGFVLCLCMPFGISSYTACSIVGPMGTIDDMMINGPIEVETTNDWSADTGVRADAPFASGSLRGYKSLYVKNNEFNTSTGDWKYTSFIKYFEVVRTDGRLIYDDDGVLDVSWNNNGVLTLTDEVVDYTADLYVMTQILNYNYKGFLGTILNAKYEEGSELIINWGNGSSPSKTIKLEIHDKDANNMGSGNYRNVGVNPGPEYYKLCDIHHSNEPFVSVEIDGTGYWCNGWWGGDFDFTAIERLLSGFIARETRDWANNLKVADLVQGSYLGKIAYYSPKPYVVIAENLNNYIKINGILATPQYNTQIVPYKDGHHINITREGYTLIELEHANENSYTPYYCFIDTKLPDISYKYSNSNALNNRIVGAVSTGTTGAKTQTINEGVFKDQVQVNFTTDLTTESPEKATYTYNGKTYTLSNGMWLNQEGDYIVTITDLAGNKTISKFTIDCSAPQLNLNRLKNDSTYKVGKWYLVNIPSNYVGSGTYSFKDRAKAESFAFEIEKQNFVTTYLLNNIEDFANTHLIASGDNVKVGTYYYYKSRDNPNLYVYYFNKELLDKVILYYACEFISQEQVIKLSYSNDCGQILDSSIYDNVVNKSYLANNFVFKQESKNDSYKVYYNYQDGKEDWKELRYNVGLKEQLNVHGLYKIKELDFVGHEIYYYVFIDLQAPIIEYQAKIYGKEKIINNTISINDIPANNELIYYYESFAIKNIIEDDKWWAMEIKSADSIFHYTYLDALPSLESLGVGHFEVIIADRNNNKFGFDVVILGKAPNINFETIDFNIYLKVKINSGESFNTITDIKIYRNETCINSDNGYKEQVGDENNIIFVNPNITEYKFYKGGLYHVEITDNFGRVISSEFKFEKELPKGELIGVLHGGKTNKAVQFVYDNDKYLLVVELNRNSYEPSINIDKNIYTLNFLPNANAEEEYKLKLIDRTDFENYNLYTFTIKTICPVIELIGVDADGITGGNVYATWQSKVENYIAKYIHNNLTYNYIKGQELSKEGLYQITLIDEIGNEGRVCFEIDKTINFLVEDVQGNILNLDEISNINYDIRIKSLENLSIKLYQNNKLLDYDFDTFISSEGDYTTVIYDEFQNIINFSFIIDKTPPKVTLYGVENFGKTNAPVWLGSSESGLKSYYILDNNQCDYLLGQELLRSGCYKVFVQDLAENLTVFEFEIDREVLFDINTYNGGIANGNIRLIAYENLNVIMYKNAFPIEYNFEEILNEEGEYSYTLTDELGNKYTSTFTIITKKKQNLNHLLQQGISIESVQKDNKNYEFKVVDNMLYLYDEGSYIVTINDDVKNCTYQFEIVLDKTAPTLCIEGVANGEKTSNVVTLNKVSEKPYNLYITIDGIKFEYVLGEEIEKCGQFKVLLSDEAGNITEYSFERIYSLNSASIAALAGLGVLVLVVIIFLVKTRHRYKRDEIVEEDIEETIVESEIKDET